MSVHVQQQRDRVTGVMVNLSYWSGQVYRYDPSVGMMGTELGEMCRLHLLTKINTFYIKKPVLPVV